MELALASGRSQKSVIREFGVPRDALRRHWHLHVSAARKAELLSGPVEIEKLANRAADEDRSLIDYLAILRSALFRMFQEARDKGRIYDANVISSNLLRVLEAIGKVNGQLRTVAGITINNQVNGAPVVLADAELAQVQALIINTLRPFPEARAAVIEALEDASLSATDGLPHKSPFPDRPLLEIEGTVAHG